MKLPLKIQNIYSADLDCGAVKKYVPEDVEDIYFQTYFEVLNTGTKEFYEFQVEVCTPKGLARVAKDHNLDLISDRCNLIYHSYNYARFFDDLNRILDECNIGGDFNVVTLRLQRYFMWEYEGEVGIKSVVLESN